jgi:tetratricopeptide (TPR) repeat protein
MTQARCRELMQWQRHVAGLCCALTLATSARGLAQTPALTNERGHDAAGDPSLEARAQHERGIVAFGEGHYAQAIEAFTTADKLWPDPYLSYNIARAYEQLHDEAKALAHYRDYLRRAPHADDNLAVQARVDELARRAGQSELQAVKLQSEPSGASVWVDDEPVGTAPVTLRLSTGVHRVSFQHAGYRSEQLEFRLTPGQRAPEIYTALEAADAEQQASGASTEAEQPARDHEDYAPRQPVLRHVGVATMIAGMGALGGAIALEIMRADAARTASRETEQVRFAKALDEMQTRQTWARVFVGAGGALTALGITLLVLSRNQDRATEPKTRVALHCAPSKCRAELSGTF